VNTSIAPEETLAGVLGDRARRTPEDRLFLDVIGGVLIGTAAIWARPLGWFPLLAAAVCFASYGCWAFAERHISAAARSGASASRSWCYTRKVAAAVGLSAFVTLLFALLGVALGKLIS
jgi:hypothetical protein